MALGKVGRVAYLEFDIDGLPCLQPGLPFGQGGTEITEAEEADFGAVLCVGVVTLRDVEDVLVDVFLHHEPGTAAEEEALALSDGVEPVALVGAKNLAGLELDNLALLLAEVAAQEVVVVDLAEETDALRVLAVGRGQLRLVGDAPHVGLHHVADGEHQFPYLTVVELREEVGLVLHRVEGSGEEDRTADLGGTGIMARGGAVVSVATALLEGTELDEFVAHHVGVGREAATDALDGVRHHVVPVLFVEVDLLETEAVFAGYIARYLNILLGGTVDVAFLVLHADADIEKVGVVALFLEQVDHHRAVDAAGDECCDVHAFSSFLATIRMTEPRMRTIPTARVAVKLSPKTKMPIRTAVRGSRAPRMAVTVEPTYLAA